MKSSANRFERRANLNMTQMFMVIVKGTIDDIEVKCNDVFLELFEDGQRIVNTKIHVNDNGEINAFIQYHPVN
jgi:hypothetical protein